MAGLGNTVTVFVTALRDATVTLGGVTRRVVLRDTEGIYIVTLVKPHHTFFGPISYWNCPKEEQSCFWGALVLEVGAVCKMIPSSPNRPEPPL